MPAVLIDDQVYAINFLGAKIRLSLGIAIVVAVIASINGVLERE